MGAFKVHFSRPFVKFVQFVAYSPEGSYVMDYKSRTKVARILIDDAVPVGSNVIILGWVRTVRSSREVAFIEVNDGSCMKNIQGVIQQPEAFPILEQILTGA